MKKNTVQNNHLKSIFPLAEDNFAILESKQKKQSLSKDQKTIPAEVLFRHFQAIAQYIELDTERYNLNRLLYFKNKLQRNTNAPLSRVEQLLLNAWNTEYLLLFNTQEHEHHPNYLRLALHWAFPQAYYSSYLTMFAAYTAKGVNCRTHEALIKQFASLSTNDAYPTTVSYFAEGEKGNYRFKNLPQLEDFHKKNALDPILSPQDCASQIAILLKTTRDESSEHVKKERQSRGQTAIKTKEGDIRKKFSSDHWVQIAEKVGYTTLFDFLYRMRLKANYQDVRTFINADVDFKAFHKAMYSIVAYLNFIHESYTTKSIGQHEMQRIVEEFSEATQSNFVQQRFEKLIKPLL
ncbi:MAG: hypothetical protein EAZ57_06250 [Cytophagales bacterium]|nr:MAG: hypothetical protein EAZ67_08440 [Cytophagales bacterium]TAF60782.1 MAG: hypothetical protein EAZ57_06250 [Cytophagales bacterium]